MGKRDLQAVVFLTCAGRFGLQFGLALLLCMPAKIYAGRPLFTDIDFQTLVSNSDAILKVAHEEWLAPPSGCKLVQIARVKVLQQLKTRETWPLLAVATFIDVAPAGSEVLEGFCAGLEKGGAGFTYPASRYVSQSASTSFYQARQGQEFLIFLRHRPKGRWTWEFTAAGGWEAPKRAMIDQVLVTLSSKSLSHACRSQRDCGHGICLVKRQVCGGTIWENPKGTYNPSSMKDCQSIAACTDARDAKGCRWHLDSKGQVLSLCLD